MPCPALARSFSLFSLFRSAPAPVVSKPSVSTLAPLFSLPAEESPTPPQTVRALSAFQTYLVQLRSHLEAQKEADASELLAGALRGYGHAVFHAARVGWGDDGTEDAERLRQSLSTSLKGVVGLYRILSADPDGFSINEEQMAVTRKALLASISPQSAELPHGQLVPIFARARTIIASLQATLRPTASSKAVSRASPRPVVAATDAEADEIMALLQVFADRIESVEALVGPMKSKTKAQKEQDKRRPLRIGIEARVLRCDVAMSMANRDIKAIKVRARRALPDEEDGEMSSDVEKDDKGAKWERIADEALIEVLEVSRALIEDKRGGVLSDKVERSDRFGEEEGGSVPVSPVRSTKSGRDDEGDERGDESGSVDEEEDEEEDDEQVDTYPCPLRSVFRLHDRFEEQRLAVWLSLPAATRPGMGTFMRGEEGKVGEAWDGLGLLLQLDYDR
jgi:hypothetical protein